MYHVFKEFVEIEDKEYSTYSIAAPNGFVVHDVTPDASKAYNLAAKFSAAKLSPIHLRDAVEDFLAE